MGVGLVICCGGRLRWRERGNVMFETKCASCGRNYALGAGYGCYEADEEDSGKLCGRFVGRVS